VSRKAAGSGTEVVSADHVAVRTLGLVRSFGREITAVAGLDLEIPRGEIFGLVGPDGAGKTTLIQMLCGILDPTDGEVAVLGLDLPKRAAELAPRIGYMSQELSLYGNLSVGENIEFFADIHGVPAERRRERAERLLRFSRLAPFVGRLARDLSGGMKKKLALATTLVHDPEILFLDEPTTGVDPLSRRDFWELVFDFVGEGVTVVVATPYLDEAERCERVALLHEGRLLAMDTPSGLKRQLGGQMAEIWSPQQAAAVDALRRDPEVADAQIFGRSVHALLADMPAYRRVEARLRAEGIDIEAARCIDPSLEDVFTALLARTATTIRPQPAPQRGHPPAGGLDRRLERRPIRRRAERAVEVEGLTRTFGDFTAVDGISFSLETGEVFGFLGPNGSGKTTTIRMLTGILPPTRGSARVVGIDTGLEAHKIRPLIGYMSQKFSLYDDLTVEENLQFFSGIYGVPRGTRRVRIRQTLAQVGLEGREKIRTAELPGGWKQRLALGAAILHEPRILFLDEPTSGVDPLSRRFFWDLIFEMADTGVTVLVTTHYMDEAERCDRLGLLSSGRLVATGTPGELRERVGGPMVEVEVADPVAALSALRALPLVRQSTLYGARLHVLLARQEAEGEVRKALEAAGHRVHALKTAPLTMEDVFVALVEKEGVTSLRESAA